MRKLLSLGALMTASALALSGCGTPAPSASPTATSTTTETAAPSATTTATTTETTTATPSDTSASPSASEDLGTGAITVWVDSNREPVIKPLAAKFKTETGITVNVIVKPNETMKDQAKAQIPTGKGPDIFVGAHDWTGELVANGIVAPIELDTKAADFQDVAVKAFTYQDKVYGVPYSVENLALIRNTALAPTAPKDFADMVTTGQSLVKAGKVKRAFAVEQGDGTPYHMYPFQASYNAPLFPLKADGTYDDTKLGMCGPEGDAFAAKLSELGKTKVLDASLTGEIAKQEFATGKTPYIVTGPWNIDLFKKGGVKYAIDPIPSMGGKEAAPLVGVQGFFLSAKSQNTLAATKFLLDTLGSEEVQTELYKAGNRAPANKAAYEAAKSDADVAAFGKVGETGNPMPNTPAMAAVWKYWGATETAIVKGAAPAQWKTMCTSISKEMNK